MTSPSAMLRGETPRARTLFVGHETADGDNLPIAPVTGSEWYEAVLVAGLRGLLHGGAGRHGDRSRWDWGITLKSLALAVQRFERLAQTVAEMTPAQMVTWWTDPEMGELRRVAIAVDLGFTTKRKARA